MVLQELGQWQKRLHSERGDNCDFTIAGKYPSVIYSALYRTALYSNEGIINKSLLISRSSQLVISWLVSRMTYRLTN